MKIILLCGWTTLEPKASYQVEIISDLGYHVSLISPNTYGRSLNVLESNAKSFSFIECPKKSPIIEQFIIIRYLIFNRKNIKYLICTAFSYTSFFTIILSKFLRIKCLLLEWGSITDLPKVNLILGFLAANSYRFAEKIAYKEPHLKRRISFLFKKKDSNLFHLPNCIKITKKQKRKLENLESNSNNFEIDFLWANRPIWRRYPEFFLQASIDKRFVKDTFRFYGLNNKTQDIKGKRFLKLVKDIKNKDPKIINDYSFEIEKIFLSSKFFVFAAKDVYGNNSLLEAMSLGIIPLVSDTPWTREFVPIESALMFKNNYESFVEVLLEAKKMTFQEYCSRSSNLIKWVERNFSSEKWKYNFMNLINK